jgi:hypothetical protein
MANGTKKLMSGQQKRAGVMQLSPLKKGNEA